MKVKWSRALPSVPSSVTVIKDAAGRYFASFVIDTHPAADATRMPETDRTLGIDLGLTHFAVLSDGRKIDSPRFLRRAERKLKKTQRELSRKQKGSENRAKARLKVDRAHAKVVDARREFHHQLSTRLIAENQEIAVEDLSVAELARTRLAKSPHPGQGRPLRTGLPDLLDLRRQGWTPTPQRAGMDLCRVRHGPRPGSQCRTQCENGRRTGGIGLPSAGQTRRNPGTARRNRKPRTPDPTPRRIAAQQQVEKARILGLQPEEQVKGAPSPRSAGTSRPPRLLGVPRQQRPQSPGHPHMDLPRLRGTTGPGRERGHQHQNGGRTGRDSLWSAGKTRTCPGTAP